MRKFIGGLVIVIAVGGFVWMTKGQFDSQGESTKSTSKQEQKSNDAITEIENIAKQLKESYPDSAEALVDMHSALMGVCYKYPMDDKDIKQYVNTIRQMYSNKFNELNPEENQIAEINKERGTMAEEHLELISSKVIEIYIAQNDKGEEISAEVNVSHATNLGVLNRTYLLIKEDGLWKINGWEETKAES